MKGKDNAYQLKVELSDEFRTENLNGSQVRLLDFTSRSFIYETFHISLHLRENVH